MINDVIKIFALSILLIAAIVFFSHKASAEEIHFDNTKYILKYSIFNPETQGYMNEYFPQNES